MDVSEVLALYDEQMRRNRALEPGASVERDAGITRGMGPPGSWRPASYEQRRQLSASLRSTS